MTVEETLQLWNIPLVERLPLKEDVKQFLDNWTQQSQGENLLLTESAALDTCSSSDVAAWTIRQLVSHKGIYTFVCRVNGIQLWSNSETRLPEAKGKVASCSLVWVEELTGGNLTEHQRTLLYSFLLSIKEKRTIISISTSIEQLCEWIGEINAKLLTRNFTVIEV